MMQWRFAVGMSPPTRPRLRLRWVVLFCLAAVAVLVLWPRARAALRLLRMGSNLANWGLCMVGEEGPRALAEDPARFLRLVRRRLVNAPPADTPFSTCAELAERAELAVGAAFHRLPAAKFLEWGAREPGTASLTELAAALPRLSDWAAEARPFLNRPLGEHLRPSPGAARAIPASEPPRFVSVRGLELGQSALRATLRVGESWFVGSSEAGGLRVFESRDGGRSWASVPARGQGWAGMAGRCSGGAGLPRFRLGRLGGAETTELVTEFDEGEPFVARALAPRQTPLALGCDGLGAALLAREQDSPVPILVRCRLRAACERLDLSRFDPMLSPTADVVRIAGTIVLAAVDGDVVRSISSRDEGESFTPPTVLFDRIEWGLAEPIVSVALLPFDDVLFAYLTTKSGRIGLVSRDLGASYLGL